MVFLRQIVLSLALFGFSDGFSPVNQPVALSRGSVVATDTSLNAVILDTELLKDAQAARIAFGLCLFGAVGSAATGRVVIPNSINQWKKYLSLKGKGESLGGEELDFFGYPEPIYRNDVMQVLNNEMSATVMSEEFPIEGTYPNALHFDSMSKANEGTSQMAVRAVFDSMALGINKNQVTALKAEFLIKRYQEDLDQMLEDNKKGKLVGLTALVLLLSILGLADYFAIYHLFHGWFPGWQGFSQFPVSLFDERGVSALPDYFMYDLPRSL